MNHKDYKIFNMAFNEIIKDYKKNKKLLLDKRLSQTEKKILLAHLDIRDNNYQRVFDLSAENSDNLYFTAHINFVLGIAHNNLGKFPQALQYFENAESVFLDLSDEYVLFLLRYNQFICALNLKKEDELNKYFKYLKNSKPKGPRLTFLKDDALFSFYLFKQDIKNAKKVMLMMEDQVEKMRGSEYPTYLITCFMFSMLEENYYFSKLILSKLKQIKKFHLTENYKYMKSLLYYLLEDDPIYIREEDLARTENLKNELLCIKYLSQDDIKMASMYWEKLSQLNSDLYREDFNFTGPICLFSHCLNKARDYLQHDKIEIPEGLNNYEILEYVFSKSGGVIAKDKLFHYIWDYWPESKDDYQKLSKLIFKFKKRKGVDISTFHGSYKLKNHQAA